MPDIGATLQLRFQTSAQFYIFSVKSQTKDKKPKKETFDPGTNSISCLDQTQIKEMRSSEKLEEGSDVY